MAFQVTLKVGDIIARLCAVWAKKAPSLNKVAQSPNYHKLFKTVPCLIGFK